MKKITITLLSIILCISLVACSTTDNKDSSQTFETIDSETATTTDISELLKIENPTDEELEEIALEITKTENNITAWLFRNSFDDMSDAITIDTFDGDYQFVPSNDVDIQSVDDFIQKGLQYVTKDYMENYLYFYIGLKEDEHAIVPLLQEIDGKLYKMAVPNGTSNVPSVDFITAEVIERKDDNTAIIKLYHEVEQFDTNYFEYEFVFEDGSWKHNPSI